MTPESRIDETFRLTPAQKTALVKLNLHTVIELLYYFPTRYSSISETRNISELIIGEKAFIYGRISNLKTAKGFKSKMTYAEATVEDRTGKIKVLRRRFGVAPRTETFGNP